MTLRFCILTTLMMVLCSLMGYSQSHQLHEIEIEDNDLTRLKVSDPSVEFYEQRSVRMVDPDLVFGSAPVLFNPSESSISVVYKVLRSCCGWVDISTNSNMSGWRRVSASLGHGMRDVRDVYASVYIDDLKPNTRYYYRIGAYLIRHGNIDRNWGARYDGISMINRVYTFTTIGKNSPVSFCVINDTHAMPEILFPVLNKVQELNPTVVVWNGDATNDYEANAGFESERDTWETAVSTYIMPDKSHPEFGANTPYFFVPGNHDLMGYVNRQIGMGLVPYRSLSERTVEYADLGRCFVQRLGPIALIGIDTGTSLSDDSNQVGHSFDMETYFNRQISWLSTAVKSDSVRSAHIKVVCCHIPIVYDCTVNKRFYAEMTNILQRANINLVISAHLHHFQYQCPQPNIGVTWSQLVCGGNKEDLDAFPTVIHGFMKEDLMCLDAYNVVEDTKILETHIQQTSSSLKERLDEVPEVSPDNAKKGIYLMLSQKKAGWQMISN